MTEKNNTQNEIIGVHQKVRNDFEDATLNLMRRQQNACARRLRAITEEFNDLIKEAVKLKLCVDVEYFDSNIEAPLTIISIYETRVL